MTDWRNFITCEEVSQGKGTHRLVPMDEIYRVERLLVEREQEIERLTAEVTRLQEIHTARVRECERLEDEVVRLEGDLETCISGLRRVSGMSIGAGADWGISGEANMQRIAQETINRVSGTQGQDDDSN